jgi:integrase
MARILKPTGDFGWLREIELDLADLARPRNLASRVVTSDRLVRLGLDLMNRAAEPSLLTRLERARLYRDGLMVALLALCPIRLGNFARLSVDEDFVERGGNWWIILSADETKNGRPDERPVPEILSKYFVDWLDVWRPSFRSPGTALWPSTKGGRLAYTFVGGIITETTGRELGVRVSPHLFRSAAVHTVAMNAGDQMGIASALLHHSDPRVTEGHYAKGSSFEAAKSFQAILRAL